MTQYFRVGETPDGIVRYRVRRQQGQRVWFYYPQADMVTGACTCTCPDWEMTRVRVVDNLGIPCDIHHPNTHCKHLRRIILDLIDRGQIIVAHYNYSQSGNVATL
jgi:hypothetical protein